MVGGSEEPDQATMNPRDTHMRKHNYIGMDVHKETIVIAIAEGPGDGEAREYGAIANSLSALDRA